MNSSANSTAISSAAGRMQLPQVTLAFKRLCWKETLQLAPLVILLVTLNGILHLLPLSTDIAGQRAFHLVLLHLIPCLFASGAGALLVSQEKEQRTIGWLSSLPIASTQILRTKLCVGLACLAVVWMACLLITLVADRGLPSDLVFPNDGGLSTQFTVINSIFLLFLGIATAWRYQTPLVALVMIVPLAVLATVVTMSVQGLSPERRLPDSLLILFYIFFSGVALWYGWRSGQAFLNSTPRRFIAQNVWKRFERTGSRGNLLTAKPQGLASTLLWQFSVQNRMILIALSALVLLPALVLIVHAFEGEFEIVAVPAWLVVSWLGASVFQSDSVNQRVKFLAERGVSPRTIWWTRQIIPFGLIAVGTAIAVFLVWYVSNGKRSPLNPTDYRAYPLLLLGTPVVLIVHAAAQWLGQVMRSPIVSLIVAPAITLSAAAYVTFTVFVTGAPIWIVLFPIAIAFIATWVMTQPWMDGRAGLRYWLGQSAFLLAALMIPMMPFLLTYCLYPGIPASAEQRLLAESHRYSITSSPFELVLPPRQPQVSENDMAGAMMDMAGMGSMDMAEMGSETTGAEVEDTSIPATNAPENLQPELGFVEQIKQNVATIESQLAARSGPVTWTPVAGFLAAEAMLTRAQLDLDPKNEVAKERFQTAVRVLIEVDKRLRMSWRLIDQEFADRLEIWMCHQLRAEGGRALLGESNWSAAQSLVTDKAGRMAARRRAIIQSWNRSVYDPKYLGGMSMKTTAGLAGWRDAIANHRRISRATWLLLEYLESKDPTQVDQRFAELAAFWGSTASRNVPGGISPESVFYLPGQNWFGEWENYRPE